jgi:hypothetical protein
MAQRHLPRTTFVHETFAQKDIYPDVHTFAHEKSAHKTFVQKYICPEDICPLSTCPNADVVWENVMES